MGRAVKTGILISIGAVIALAVFRLLHEPEPGQVIRVIDGDTIVVFHDGREESVRLLRIDTPERGQKGYRESKDALRQMVEGRVVKLEFEHPGREERDKYGRLLAYVYIDGRNVNVEMVRQGRSPFWTKFGRGRYAAEFERAEQDARSAGVGMWAPKTGSPVSAR